MTNTNFSGKAGRGGWSREALTPSAGVPNGDSKGKSGSVVFNFRPAVTPGILYIGTSAPKTMGKCRIALGRGVAKGQRAGPLLGRSDERDLDVDVALHLNRRLCS